MISVLESCAFHANFHRSTRKTLGRKQGVQLKHYFYTPHILCLCSPPLTKHLSVFVSFPRSATRPHSLKRRRALNNVIISPDWCSILSSKQLAYSILLLWPLENDWCLWPALCTSSITHKHTLSLNVWLLYEQGHRFKHIMFFLFSYFSHKQMNPICEIKGWKLSWVILTLHWILNEILLSPLC